MWAQTSGATVRGATVHHFIDFDYKISYYNHFFENVYHDIMKPSTHASFASVEQTTLDTTRNKTESLLLLSS